MHYSIHISICKKHFYYFCYASHFFMHNPRRGCVIYICCSFLLYASCYYVLCCVSGFLVWDPTWVFSDVVHHMNLFWELGLLSHFKIPTLYSYFKVGLSCWRVWWRSTELVVGHFLWVYYKYHNPTFCQPELDTSAVLLVVSSTEMVWIILWCCCPALHHHKPLLNICYYDGYILGTEIRKGMRKPPSECISMFHPAVQL